MTRLSTFIKGAAMIGCLGFVADSAMAQTSAACPSHEAVVYFAPNSAALNSEQKLAIASTAEVARACGAPGVLIQANGNGERARAVATALSQRGVTATIVAQQALAPSADTMTARSITLRVASQTGTSS
jgi:outer membrane protein OmpA-like peptidoglycan-associated protein